MKKRILYVDDNPDLIRLVETRLKTHGFEVMSAEDGEAALAKADSDRPDLIVLDLGIPKVNGLDVCAQLKQNPKTKAIPIIVLTGSDPDAHVETCRRIGVEAYLVKGEASSALLLEKIHSLIAPVQ